MLEASADSPGTQPHANDDPTVVQFERRMNSTNLLAKNDLFATPPSSYEGRQRNNSCTGWHSLMYQQRQILQSRQRTGGVAFLALTGRSFQISYRTRCLLYYCDKMMLRSVCLLVSATRISVDSIVSTCSWIWPHWRWLWALWLLQDEWHQQGYRYISWPSWRWW